MHHRNYLIRYDPIDGDYYIIACDYLFVSEAGNMETLAYDIDPEIISAAIYRLLEDLKEKTIDGRNRAYGGEQNNNT